jgi:hypothetical protein
MPSELTGEEFADVLAAFVEKVRRRPTKVPVQRPDEKPAISRKDRDRKPR